MDELDKLAFRINARFYYDQLDALTISQTEFGLWINSLSEPMKSDFLKKGLEQCRATLSLQRFVLELRGYSIDKFLETL